MNTLYLKSVYFTLRERFKYESMDMKSKRCKHYAADGTEYQAMERELKRIWEFETLWAGRAGLPFEIGEKSAFKDLTYFAPPMFYNVFDFLEKEKDNRK